MEPELLASGAPSDMQFAAASLTICFWLFLAFFHFSFI
jgi:hypothetical protein